jgi:hypothetical protein
MRVPGLLCVALFLCGCAGAGGDGNPSASDTLQAGPQQIDDAKCRDLGHEPNTPGYGNCRLELEIKRGGGAPPFLRDFPRKLETPNNTDPVANN